MTTKNLGRKFALGLASCAFIFGGDCVPDRFWANTWNATLSGAVITVADTAVDLYVVDPLIEAIQNADEDE